MSEGEYYSLHDEIRDIAMGAKKKVVEMPKQYDLQDLRMAIKHLMDKVETIDRHIRNAHYARNPQTIDGEAQRKDIITKYLESMRDGTVSEEDKALFKNILSQKPKPKEISEDV